MAAPPSAEDQGAGPQALFEELLRRYAAFRDFKAQFIETALSRATGEGTPESGVVSFKRPGLWRWEYRSPERKLVVVKNGIATLLVEGDTEASRYELGTGTEASGVGALLAGGEQLSRSFLARMEPSGVKDEAVLSLEPLELSDEYDRVVVRFGRRDFVIREVLVQDPGGNRLRFRFDGFKPDQGLGDALFDPPPAPRPSKP